MLRSYNTRRATPAAAAFLAAAFAAVPCAAAAQMIAAAGSSVPPPPGTSSGFNAGFELQYTDNANLVPDNPQSDLIYVPSFGVNYSRQAPKTDASIAFQVRRDIYKNGTQQDQTFPTLNARVKWFPVPERFTWTLNDFASQNQINVQNAPTANNTQNTNAFTTGPDGFFYFGSSNTLQLGARFADTTFEDTNEDSTRAVGYARWLYSSSPRTVLSANYEASSVRFDDPANTDFDRYDLFFGVQTNRVRSNLAFNMGATVIKRTGTSDKAEPLFRFSANRQLTAKSTVGLAAAQVQAESGSNLFTSGLASPGLAPGGNVANTSDIFTDRSLNLFYTNAGLRTTATVRMFGRNQNYETTPNDQRSWGTDFNLSRRLTPRITASFLASYTDTNYSQRVPTLRDKDTTFGLNFSYRLGQWLALNAGIAWRNRNSTDPAGEYTETRAILGVTYARNRSSAPSPAIPSGAGAPSGSATTPSPGNVYAPR